MLDYIENDFLKDGYLLGLVFLDDDNIRRVFVCKVITQEPCNFVYTFDTLNPLSSTDFIELKDGTRSILVPTDEKEIKHIYYGIYPARAMLYFKIADVDRWSLFGTRTVGTQHGYVDGRISPFHTPSLRTKLFVVKDLTPYFALFNPLPITIIPKLNIVGRRYYVRWLDADKIPENKISKIRIENIGGNTPIRKPDWLKVKGLDYEKVVEVKKHG